MSATVAIDGVSKRYREVEALREVTFALKAGEIVALVGHNGAGKTTLLKLMLGLIHPTAGTIRVLDENPAAGEFAARRRLGYLPENVSFNPALSGREIISFYARLKHAPVADALALFERVGLGEAARRRVGTYSKGMRQRLGLAQALIGDPLVLLLDEPTSGLDPALRLSFYEIVQERRAAGATVVLCSHALTELERRADHVIIMNRGVLAADGTIEELRGIARLPTRIRLTGMNREAGPLHAWMGEAGPWRAVDGATIEIEAPASEKIALIRRATREGTPVADIEVLPPTLDELYAHFLRGAGAAG